MKTKWLFTVASTLLLLTGCSGNHPNFESAPTITLNGELFTRSASIDYSDYLDVSTSDVSQWTEEDFLAADQTIHRLEVSFSNEANKYVYQAPNAESINVSSTLYNCVVSMFEYTNSLFAKYNQPSIARKKTRSGESSSSSSTDFPDCVPAAVSNMGQSAPSYSDALAKCDQKFPGWRTSGLTENQTEELIEQYTSVTKHTNFGFCGFTNSHDELTVNSLVTLLSLPSGDNHAVNTYRIKNYNNYSPIKLYFNDHSNLSEHTITSPYGYGIVAGADVSCIFVF